MEMLKMFGFVFIAFTCVCLLWNALVYGFEPGSIFSDE